MTHTTNYLHLSSHLIKVVVFPADDGGGGYWAMVPSIPGIASQGDTIEEAFANIEDALRTTIQSYKDDNQQIPWHPEGEASMIREVEVAVEDMPLPIYNFELSTKLPLVNAEPPRPPNDRFIHETINVHPVVAGLLVGLLVVLVATVLHYITQ